LARAKAAPIVDAHGASGRRTFGNLWSRRGVVLAGLAAACAQQGYLSAGEQGRVARVLDGDALALDTGLRVRLVEIEAPAPGYDGRADEPWAAEARSLLETAATGRQAQLWCGGLSRDSYDRALAHVIVRNETGGEVWLNGMVVRQGGGACGRTRTMRCGRGACWRWRPRRVKRSAGCGRMRTGACAAWTILKARRTSRS
jgi:endonuclease YncB( thermonuclease family)